MTKLRTIQTDQPHVLTIRPEATMISYGFPHNIYVSFIPWQKCWNFVNLFLCILWDLIVTSLDLSGEDLLKKLISRLGLWVVQPAKVTWGAHAESWRVSVFHDSSHDLANSRDDPWNALTAGILSVTLIPFTHIIYTLITHNIVKRLFKIKP